MAGFGLPNFGQLTEAFKKAQQIQQNAQKLQEELEVMEIEGTNDDNRAKIWMSGNQKPLRVEIDPSLLSEGKAIIEEAILNAMKSAHEVSTSTMKERMEDLTGGFKLNLPGMGEENYCLLYTSPSPRD